MSNEEEVRSIAVVIVKKYFRIFVVCLFTFMLIGCNGKNDLPGGPSEGEFPLVPDGASMNLVELTGLDATIEIHAFQFDLENESADEPYIPIFSLSDPQLVGEFISALDVEIHESYKLACIPEYQLFFHLEDGSIEQIEFSCSGASFIRGEQDFFQGKDFYLPEEFVDVFRSHLPPEDVSLPTSVNVFRQAELAGTVEIEILEQIISEESGSGDQPAINTAQISSLFTIDDLDTIAQILAALDVELDVSPRIRCPSRFILLFRKADGNTQSIGYTCSDENLSILRGDQEFFGGLDAQAPDDFIQLMQEILESAQ